MSRTIEIIGEHKFISIKDVRDDGKIHRCLIGPNAPAIDDETQALKGNLHTQEVIDSYNASIAREQLE